MTLTKRLTAAALALATALCAAGCDSNSNESSSYVDKVDVVSTDKIEAIPEGAEKELDWCSYYDLNPTSAQPEKSVELTLFEEKGGKINYIRSSSMGVQTKLSSLILANTPPDIYPFSHRMTVPCNAVAGMFQPVDSIVDFDSALWSDKKGIAEQYMIGDKHYVAPISFGNTMPIIFYDEDTISREGLDNPYTLYENGEWDWNAMYDIIEQWVSSAPGDEERYGINGYFAEEIFMTTGQTIITKDEKTGEYINNSKNADLERAADFLYSLGKAPNYYLPGWIEGAANAFEQGCLFYAMGSWGAASNNAPEESDHWMCVPIPKDPNKDEYYRSTDVFAYMWVNGSTKKDAVKCWFECAKIANTDSQYVEAGEKKFFENNPHWSEEAYQIAFKEVFSDKFTFIVDPGKSLTAELSDDASAQTVEKEAVNTHMYNSVLRSDAETGVQYSWTQVREQYSGTIDSELKTFNATLKKFIENGNKS